MCLKIFLWREDTNSVELHVRWYGVYHALLGIENISFKNGSLIILDIHIAAVGYNLSSIKVLIEKYQIVFNKILLFIGIYLILDKVLYSLYTDLFVVVTTYIILLNY